MKATDKQLIDISEELTAHIIKPTSDLHLNHEECIILNKLITEEFERRQEQDVMGSSNGQDTSLGQTGADNNDGNINASECWNNEASGTPLREKKKPQITKVSKKEYWENRDKHGTYIGTYFETYDMTDQPESHFGKEPYEEHEVPYKKIAEKGSEVTEAVDKLITGTRGDELAEKRKADDDDSIPIAWLKSEIEETRKFLKTETNERIMHDEIAYIVNINSIINCWGRYGKYDWKEKEKNTNETTIPLESLDLGTFQFPIDT